MIKNILSRQALQDKRIKVIGICPLSSITKPVLFFIHVVVIKVFQSGPNEQPTDIAIYMAASVDMKKVLVDIKWDEHVFI